MSLGEVLRFVNQFLPWDQIGLMAGVILVGLLSGRELARAYAGPRVLAWGRSLNPAVIALLLVFTLAVVERVAYRYFMG